MVALLNLLKFYILLIITTFKFVRSAAPSIEDENPLEIIVNENGILRKEDNCNIVFVNFGMNDNIINLRVSKIIQNESGIFNLKIENLINGNMGPNNKIYLNADELKSAIKILQNEVEITDFELSNITKKTGLMNMEIKNLSTCEGLTIKQTFKESLISVANRMYYETVIPPRINQSFDAKKFGPSYSYPLERIHWKINEGLDELRETCGIHIYYKSVSSSNGYHWQYFISVENGNTKECSDIQFFNILKAHYTDYKSNDDILHDNYRGYVLKREGHIEEHMDGIIVDKKYLIEIYQKKCGKSESRITCIIPSNKILSFKEFTDALTKECLNIDDTNSKWIINNDVAIGQLNNQIVTIKASDADKRGSLPDIKIDESTGEITGNIKYYIFSSTTSVSVARFLVSFNCQSGSYNSEDNCRCQACPLNCSRCNDSNSCIKCNKGSSLIDNTCVADSSSTITYESEIVDTSDVKLVYINNGVIRENGNCDIVFTNFGMENFIKNLSITKFKQSNSDMFTLRIEGLVNVNIGPNNIDAESLKNAIKIQQNGNSITDFEITVLEKGLMDIDINNLNTCEGLSLKQTFLETFKTVATRHYYENVIPKRINQSFDAKKFGPPYSYAYERIHWNINKGLDDLMKNCGIYIDYTSVSNSNGVHWQYYLSVENSKTEKQCTHKEFFDSIKSNFDDYDRIENVIDEGYIGYVLKREGHIEEHMDGIVPNKDYQIEVYQKKSGANTLSRIVCDISSDEALSFTEFTNELTSKCLKIEDTNLNWTINNGEATVTTVDKDITITASDVESAGSLPENIEENINYTDKSIIQIARFIVKISEKACENPNTPYKCLVNGKMKCISNEAACHCQGDTPYQCEVNEDVKCVADEAACNCEDPLNEIRCRVDGIETCVANRDACDCKGNTQYECVVNGDLKCVVDEAVCNCEDPNNTITCRVNGIETCVNNADACDCKGETQYECIVNGNMKCVADEAACNCEDPNNTVRCKVNGIETCVSDGAVCDCEGETPYQCEVNGNKKCVIDEAACNCEDPNNIVRCKVNGIETCVVDANVCDCEGETPYQCLVNGNKICVADEIACNCEDPNNTIGCRVNGIETCVANRDDCDCNGETSYECSINNEFYCVKDKNECICTNPQITYPTESEPGSPYIYTIQCLDKNNNTITEGGAIFTSEVSLKIKDNDELIDIETEILDNENGSYNIMFMPTLPGNYTIYTKMNGNIINELNFNMMCKNYTCPNDSTKCVDDLRDCIPIENRCLDPEKKKELPFRCNGSDTCVDSMTKCIPEGAGGSCKYMNALYPFGKSNLCSYYLPLDCKRKYPNYKILCNDGICRKNKNLQPNQRVCPIGQVLCADLTCKDSVEECYNDWPECGNTQIRCPDQSCVDDQKNCPSTITCSDPSYVVCPDGTCVENEIYCSKVKKCPEEAPYLCTDYSCATFPESCPHAIACGHGKSLCDDLKCREVCN